MKKIITAINNPKLNEELKKENNFKIIGKDIQYREAILEILEKNSNIDMIILSEKILGEIKLETLIKKIRLIREEIKIIFILEKENNELEKLLLKNNIVDIYYNNKINLKEMIKIINKKEINMEEEIVRLRKMIEERDNKDKEIENRKYKPKNKRQKDTNIIKEEIEKKVKNMLNKIKKVNNSRNMSTKIITFSGNSKSGKTTLSLIISQYLSEKNYKVLLIDGDFEKNDLSLILKRNKRKKNYLKKNKNKFNKKRRNIKNKIYHKYKILINKKNTIYQYHIKQMIYLTTQKMNKNFNFFYGLYNLFHHKVKQKEKMLKKIIFIYLKTIKYDYNFILVDLSKNNFHTINEILLKNSDINFVLMEPTILGINEIQKTLVNYLQKWKINKNSLHIVSNKRKFNSINKNLIYHSISPNHKIYDIKENIIFNFILNNYFRKKFLLKNKKIKKEINKIIYKIIIK